MVMNNELNRNSRTPEEPTSINADHIRQPEAYKFLQKAYNTGINIIIEGVTCSGRTTLLKNLINSAENNESTILLTPFFEMETPKVTQIKGDDPLWLIHQARRMNPFRIVMDDLHIKEEEMELIVSGALTGTQFVSTGYTDSSRNFSETDSLSSRYVQHPYELRVHVALTWNDEKKKGEFDILSISQIIHQKVSNTGGDRKSIYDSTSNLLLFEGDNKVAFPTRTMRRKIEFAQHLQNPKNDSVSSLKSPTFTETSAPNFVSVSPEDKAKLLKHREILHEHFQSQSEHLQESFKEIEKLLARI